MFDRDFDGLEGGDRFVTRGRTITEADVVSFACLTGDMHPQHTDRDWAASSLFGERVAHGMLVASFALGMLPFDPERVIALRRGGDAVFKRPVWLGDTIHAVGGGGRVGFRDALRRVGGRGAAPAERRPAVGAGLG